MTDPRIDVFAQYSFQRLGRSAPDDASGMLAAVRTGALRGIYKEDEAVPARAAQRLGRGWWQLIPFHEDAISSRERQQRPWS